MTTEEAVYWISQGRCIHCHQPVPLYGRNAMNAQGVCVECRKAYRAEVRAILSHSILGGAQ